ncbi:hypothetical protein [Paramicrobacterium fandaimingii]|uniref:hypothetical protein n=1 Tax=Paramicrobacterium fandaimingii TaxID=2708079 RepID=UPI001423D8BA|nr:hypothetical protein [Microbacterium fandaimingii]
MSNDSADQQTPDAVGQGGRHGAPLPRSEPWTGQGPVIRNPPDSAHPYGTSPEPQRSPVRRGLSPWIVAAVIAVLAIIVAGIVLALVL